MGKSSKLCLNVLWALVFVLSLPIALFANDEQLTVRSERPLQAESEAAALEPFETPISGFFIRNHHDVPIVDPEKHVIKIQGLVENPISLTISDLSALPQKSFYAVLECSGNKRSFQLPAAGGIQWEQGAVGNAEWTGVALRELLEKAKPQKNARFITVRGADKPALPSTPEFIRSIPIEKAYEPDSLLALKMNREPLPLLHGGPVRLVLPRWYGQNWIKWVTEINLTAEEDQGFYMKKAYRMPKKQLKVGEEWNSETGNPIQELLVQSLIVAPRSEERVAVGNYEVKGKAFSGFGTVVQVELSWDQGKTWHPARLSSVNPKGGWQEFDLVIPVKKKGLFRLLSRAKDSQGNIQPLKHNWNPSGYLRNAVDGVSFMAVEPKIAEGYSIYKNRCLMCHSEGLILSQPLKEIGWKKLIGKMKLFGAQITETEEPFLLAFLNSIKPRTKEVEQRVSYETESRKYRIDANGTTKDTRNLYELNCRSCHGVNGEGKIGPRLRGRLIPKYQFLTTVSQGKNSMPAFGEQLKQQEIEWIWAFLQRPEE